MDHDYWRMLKPATGLNHMSRNIFSMITPADAPSRSPARRTGDRHRLPMRLALPLLVATLVVGAAGELVYWHLSGSIRNETHRTLAVIAEQKRQEIEALLAEPRIEAELYFSGKAQVPALLGQWLEGGRQDDALLTRIRDRIEEVAHARGWGGVAVLDAEARPVFVQGEVAPQALETPLREILNHPRVELVDLHRNPRGVPEYGVLAPIGPERTAPLGMVYVVWQAHRSLYPLVKSWPVPTRTAETYLVRRDGDRVRFLTPLRHVPDAELTLTLPLSQPHLPAALAARGQRGIVAGGRDYRDVPVLAYAAAVAGTPWSMVAEIDENEAYAGIRTTAWTIAAVMGLILLLLYAGGYFFWRRELAALHARQTSEARFRFIFEQAPLGIAVVDSHTGRIVEANPRYAEILGRTPEEMATLDWMRVTHPEDLRKDLDHMVQLNAGEIGDFRSTKRYLRPDGSAVWVNLTVAQLKVGNGDGTHNLAIAEDIDERQRMQEKLRISEEKFRSLVETSSDCIWEVDADGRYTYLSPRFQEMTGYPPTEFLGRTPFDLLPDHVVQQVRERMSTSLSARQPFSSLQQPVQHRDGRLVIAEVNGVPLLGPEGEYRGMRGVTRDITERKHAEYTRDAALAKYLTLFESFPLGIVVSDGAGKILEVNQAATRLTGVSMDEHRSRTLNSPAWRVLRRDGTPMPVDEYPSMRALREGRGLYCAQLGILRPDGAIAWLAVSAAPLPAPESGAVATYSDITDQVCAETTRETASAVAELAASCDSPERFCRDLPGLLAPRLGFPIVAVETLDPVRREMVFAGIEGVPSIAPGLRVPLSETLSGLVAQSGQPWIEADMASLPESLPAPMRELGIVTFVSVPLKLGQQAQGSLTIADTRRRPEAPRLVAALRVVAETVAEACERLEAQAALSESEHKFRRLFDATPLPLVYARRDGEVRDYNRRFAEVFGYTRQDLPTLDAWWPRAYPDPDYRDWVKRTWEAAVKRAESAGSEIEPAEYRIMCKDGSVRSMVVSGTLIEGDLLATFFDITDRRQAEAELEQSRHLLRDLVESIAQER